MKHRAIEQVIQRADHAKSDSDFTFFFSQLLAAEALAKTIVAGMVASIGDDKDRNRYRLEHSLVRADGIGDWGKAIEDTVSGAASQYLLAEARKEQGELTKRCKAGEWQHDAVMALKKSARPPRYRLRGCTNKFRHEKMVSFVCNPSKQNACSWCNPTTSIRNRRRIYPEERCAYTR